MSDPLLDKYFEKDLSKEEEEQLLKQVEEDAILKEEMHFQTTVKKAIHSKEREELKAFLKVVEKKKRRFRLIAGMAASLLVLFGLWFFSLEDSPNKLADNYFQPLPNLIQPTVRGESQTNKVFEAYDSENYVEAVTEFKKILNEPYSNLYLGVSYLALNDVKDAISILEKYRPSDTVYEDYRKWYLSLAYLKNNEKTKAVDLLTELTQKVNPVQEQAKKILNDLK